MNDASSFMAMFYLFYFVLIFAVEIPIIAMSVVANWFIFKKAGKAGWEAVVPYYNSWVLYEIVCGEGVKMLFLLIPFYNIYWLVMTNLALARAFGKSTEFALGLIFLGPVFHLILAFDKSEYQGVQTL